MYVLVLCVTNLMCDVILTLYCIIKHTECTVVCVINMYTSSSDSTGILSRISYIWSYKSTLKLDLD